MLLDDDRIQVNRPRDNGGTPFFQACKSNATEVIKILLKSPRINVSPCPGSCPVRLACENKNHEILSLLVKDGRFPMNVSNPNGITPLLVTLKKALPDCAKWLLASGTNIDTFGEVDLFLNRPVQRGPALEEVINLILHYRLDSLGVATRLRHELGLSSDSFFLFSILLEILSENHLVFFLLPP